MAAGTSITRLFRPSICSSCRQSMRTAQRAPLSTSPRRLADDKTSPKPAPTQPPMDTDNIYEQMTSTLQGFNITPRSANRRQSTQGIMDSITSRTSMVPPQQPGAAPAMPTSPLRNGHHHLHIYAHKHNTHIVLTRPNREPILSYSAGNIGFRKAQRGSFDAAFQLAAYVMRTISDKGLLRSTVFAEGGSAEAARKLEAPIKEVEVVLRGWGKGREAVVKALLGAEGRFLREKIRYVSDDTKLKFGGTRSPNPRRLG